MTLSEILFQWDLAYMKDPYGHTQAYLSVVFSTIYSKGDNICNFLFACLN